MAERFTDSEKWKKPWFSALPHQGKLFWFYLLDNCDHAGFWPENYKLASFQLEYEVSECLAHQWFGGRIKKVNDKILVLGFAQRQYKPKNGFSPDSKVHLGVIRRFEAERCVNLLNSPETLSEPLPNGSETLTKGYRSRSNALKKGGVGENKLEPEVLAEEIPDPHGQIAQELSIRKVKIDAQRKWLALYGSGEWVGREILKALAWECANPSRRKKDLARFLNGWLSRGWDQKERENPKPTQTPKWGVDD